MIDLYFLTPHERFGWPACHWQGQVLSEVTPGMYLVQLYSWATGVATNQALARLDDMTSWVFFTDSNEWNRAANDASQNLERLQSQYEAKMTATKETSA